jgi:hypothetical protein
MVHLLEYRAVPGHEAELTGFLKRRPLLEAPVLGLDGLIVARRLSHNGREHLAVTCWNDAESFARGTDEKGIPAYLSSTASLVGDRIQAAFDIVAFRSAIHAGARVLRLYRTSIPSAAIGIWEERAVASAAQLAETEGLALIQAGLEIGSPETPLPNQVRVVVMTAWTEWDLLLAATGGRLNRALPDTELPELEKAAAPDHFEILALEAFAS